MPRSPARAPRSTRRTNPKKPTFGNTIVALERQGELLNRIAGLFFNLLEADTSDEMQQIAQRVRPKLTELSNDISLNPGAISPG